MFWVRLVFVCTHRLLLWFCQVLPTDGDDAEQDGRRGPRAERGDRFDQPLLLCWSQWPSSGERTMLHRLDCRLGPAG